MKNFPSNDTCLLKLSCCISFDFICIQKDFVVEFKPVVSGITERIWRNGCWTPINPLQAEAVSFTQDRQSGDAPADLGKNRKPISSSPSHDKMPKTISVSSGGVSQSTDMFKITCYQRLIDI